MGWMNHDRVHPILDAKQKVKVGVGVAHPYPLERGVGISSLLA